MPINKSDLVEGKTYRYNWRGGEVSLLRYLGELHHYGGLEHEHIIRFNFEDILDEVEDCYKAEFVPIDIHTGNKTRSFLSTYLCFFDINYHPEKIKKREEAQQID